MEEQQIILINKLYILYIHRGDSIFILKLVYPRKYSHTASANFALAVWLEHWVLSSSYWVPSKPWVHTHSSKSYVCLPPHFIEEWSLFTTNPLLLDQLRAVESFVSFTYLCIICCSILHQLAGLIWGSLNRGINIFSRFNFF